MWVSSHHSALTFTQGASGTWSRDWDSVCLFSVLGLCTCALIGRLLFWRAMPEVVCLIVVVLTTSGGDGASPETCNSWTETSGSEQTGSDQTRDPREREAVRGGPWTDAWTGRWTRSILLLLIRQPLLHPVRSGPCRACGRSGSHGGQHGGRDPGHLPPGGPGDPLPDPDQCAPAARHAGGFQTGPEQAEREILL